MADEITVFQEIDWDPKPTLVPGMDYHDGTTYFTIPLMRNVIVPAKKKGEESTVVKRMETFTLTSDREGVWYAAEDLDNHGFVPHKHFIQEEGTRWSYPSVRAFLDTDLTGPSSQDLYDEIRNVYTTYVEFAHETYFDIMTLYVMYTYVYRLFESTGYIHFNGTAASGKSRNLSILQTLAFNTIWASSMSPASLYRKLSGAPGTTCIDETEGFEGERGEEFRRILNAGYKKGATVMRSEKDADDRWVSGSYDVFGPKALASINVLEPVIQSRSIVVAMRPAIRELPDFLSSDKQWPVLRDKLYLWAMSNTDAIAALVAEWFAKDSSKKARLCPKLIGRQWETTAQYIVLADYIGGEAQASSLITFFNSYFASQQEAADATDRIRTTLRSLPRVLATKTPHPGNLYSVKDIHEVVSSYMEADATEYFKTKHVGKNLEVLGFKHKVRGTGGLRIQLDESAVRHEFVQRRVEPYEEDIDWLAGKTTYQSPTSFFDVIEPPTRPTPKPTSGRPFWETDDDTPEIN